MLTKELYLLLKGDHADMKSIGIDIGTTTISIIVMNVQDYTIEQKYTLDNGMFLPTSSPWERVQDVPSILSTARTVLEEILNSDHDISSIGLTGQMHGIVYIDKDGAAVSPLYTWQDGRGNLPDYQESKSVISHLSEIYHIKASTGYGMVTHLYNVKKGLVPPEAVSFCTISDYLGMQLTGRKLPLLHISQAASLGLYDCKAHAFLSDILTENKAMPPVLPQITTDFVPIGLFHGIPVTVSIGDNQASFLGSVREGQNSILVNVGTGSQISVLSGVYYEGRGIEARPLAKDTFLLAGAALCGGAAYAALENFFREYAMAAGAPDVPQFDIMKQLLEQQKNPTETWNVRTTFAGTREHPDESGSIHGIRTDNFHPASLIRGVLNGMTEELYELYDIIKEETRLSRTRLVASGNGIRKNKTLQQILQTRFEMPLEVVQTEEEAAFGAAISSLTAIGEVSLEQWIGL